MERRWICLAGVLVVACVGACSYTHSVECDNGFTCPEGMTCVLNQRACVLGDCGNGVVDEGEVCDDGNITNDDGCSADCKSTELCGNGHRDPNEECDDGNPLDGDGCDSDCTTTACGNGITTAPEACDDGRQCSDGTSCTDDFQCPGLACRPRSGDGCSADCLSDETCGNGFLDPGERCDDGNGIDTDDCTGCVVNVCGDGVHNQSGPVGSEECDDGVQTATCDADCTAAMCGDGVVNSLASGEQCDNLATCESGITCATNATCTGDGDELCRSRDSATCNSNCTIAYCGDGITNPLAAEACDNGATNGNGNCTFDCLVNVCGDGVVDLEAPGVETCDDNNVSNCGSCNSSCTGAGAGPTCASGIGCAQGIDCVSGVCSAGLCM